MRSFASRSRRVSATTSFSAISGCSRISVRMSPRRQREQLGVLGGLDARRARSPSSIASSPKIAPGPRVASVIARPSGVLAGDPAAPVADDVAGVARVPLVEDARVARKAARDRHLGDPLELGGRELREQRHAAAGARRLLGSLRLPLRRLSPLSESAIRPGRRASCTKNAEDRQGRRRRYARSPWARDPIESGPR